MENAANYIRDISVIEGNYLLKSDITPEKRSIALVYGGSSLSEDQKERAIGIIVSGTASDGTLGIKAIKGEGGMAMVQDPATAKYDGMPKSAIATGMVDFIVPVEKMAQTLLGYIRHPFLNSW